MIKCLNISKPIYRSISTYRFDIFENKNFMWTRTFTYSNNANKKQFIIIQLLNSIIIHDWLFAEL